MRSAREHAARTMTIGRRDMISYRLSRNPGKITGLRQITTNGVLVVAALDHRRTFEPVFGSGPDAYRAVRELKRHLVDALAPHASALLLDPNFMVCPGVAPAGLIMTLEAPGFERINGLRTTATLDGWSVAKAKSAGASAAKLLVHIDPDSRASVHRARELMSMVSAECADADLLFLAEPLVACESGDFGHHVLSALESLGDIPADLFKIQYPGDELVSKAMELVDVPWVVLSGGVEFAGLPRVLDNCYLAGCSGFALGRSVWRELLAAPDPARTASVVADVVAPRFAALADSAARNATPVWSRVIVTDDITPDWYKGYA